MTNVVNTARAGAQLASFKSQYQHLNRFLGALDDLEEQMKVLKTFATSEVFCTAYPDFAAMIQICKTLSKNFFDKKEEVLEEIRKEIAKLFDGSIPLDLAAILSDFEDDPKKPQEPQEQEVSMDLGVLDEMQQPTDLGALEEPVVDPNAVPYVFISGNNTFSFAEVDREVFATKVANKIRELRAQGVPERELPPNFQNLNDRYLVDIARAIFDDRLSKKAVTEDRVNEVREVREFSAKTSTKG